MFFWLLACASRNLQRESFHKLFDLVEQTAPPGSIDLDTWANTEATLWPQAKRTRTAASLRPILTNALSTLEMSHYTVLPGTVAEVLDSTTADLIPVARGLGDPGLDVRIIEGAATVVRVLPNGPAQQAGLVLGDQILVVGDIDVPSRLTRLEVLEDPWTQRAYGRALVLAAFMQPTGSEVEVQLGGSNPRSAQLELTAGMIASTPGYLGPQPLHIEAGLIEEFGYFAFDQFQVPVPERFTEAITTFRDAEARGLILDLRGNAGGLVLIVRGLAGHLMGDATQSLGTMKTMGSTLRLNVNPRAVRFDGPVVVLIDELSLSTAEVLAAGLKELRRATVVGEPTPGRSLPSTVVKLPNGDRLQMVTGSFLTPEGNNIEGVGVQPDIHVGFSIEDHGTDPVIEAAIQALRGNP